MKKPLALAPLLVGASLFSIPAFGEGLEFWFNAGQSIVSNPGLGTAQPCTSTALCQAIGATSDDIKLTNGFRFSLRGDFNTGEHHGFEMGYAYNRTQLHYTDGSVPDQGMAYHQVMFNYVVYATSQDAKFRPFATGGVGFATFVQPGASAAYGGGSTKFGFNYGGGVKIKVHGPYQARFDVRQVATPKPFGLPLASGWFRSTEISAGVGFGF